MHKSKQRLYQALGRQVRRLDHRLQKLYRRSETFTRLRLLTFMLSLILALSLGFTASWSWGVAALVLGLFAFGGIIIAHYRLEQQIIAFQTWHEIKATHMARMKLDWNGIGYVSPATVPETHPFASDLDLLGPQSLFHLLDTAITQEGSRQLLTWLINNNPELKRLQHRQEQVRFLSNHPLFCDRLSLNARLAATGAVSQWQFKPMQTWLDAHAEERPAWLLVTGLAGLALVNLGLLAFYLLGGPILPWLLGLAVYLLLTGLRWAEITAALNTAVMLRNSLRQVESVFAFLESSPHTRHPILSERCRPFHNPAQQPSLYIRRLNRLAAAIGLAGNPALGLLLNLIVPWSLFFAQQLKGYQRELQDRLPQWLTVWFELEALAALATFSYLNPNYTYPRLKEQEVGEKPFSADELGHPLISDADKVTNDFDTDSLGDVCLITGSNMSGKSTFLRTLGLNLRLAFCGAPVDARHFETRLFRVFTCIQINDSLASGFSFFYAEVQRLKAMLTELEKDDPLPLFYLVDEIFRGTNNRERLIGSQSLIRHLVGKHGYGLIATHDLALVQLADEIPQVQNYHFRDDVVEGKMSFDYTLREGPCPTTNALRIMHLAGLPIPTPEEPPRLPPATA